ncbi:histone deacetylase 11 [Platysternon megacephalum]|uniref:Histone deacetylase 11 n=1 Tax=Platysternon megacephalum TaxID=55544 RepID=A0A4D9E0M0_9SAUR|nr:histone deacetylase 11 [Platysternon megacephalum]
MGKNNHRTTVDNYQEKKNSPTLNIQGTKSYKLNSETQDRNTLLCLLSPSNTAAPLSHWTMQACDISHRANFEKTPSKAGVLPLSISVYHPWDLYQISLQPQIGDYTWPSFRPSLTVFRKA